MADRGDNHGQETHRSGEAREHWHPDAPERQAYDRQVDEMNEGGLPDEVRAAQEARLIEQQQGSLASRLDPEGLGARRPAQDPAQVARQQAAQAEPIRGTLDGPIDTREEVHMFTGGAQKSPDAAVSSGTDGEADLTGRSGISERLSGLDESRDERD